MMNHTADLLSFLDESPTPRHAVAAGATRLLRHGYVESRLADAPAAFSPGGKGFMRIEGSLFAWQMGSEAPERAGFRILAAHTDSPNLRIKPQPLLKSQGYVRLGVDVYGGVQVPTWVDRDLGVAGAVYVREGQSASPRLVAVRKPVARIPTLAIHLNRGVNEDGLKLNAQTQLPAMLSLESSSADPLRALLAEAAQCEPGDLLTWDLALFDLTPATLGGARDEFVFSARLDNLASCHASLQALLSVDDVPAQTRVVALFDHEEIGSQTNRGADGRAIEVLLRRLARQDLDEALTRSWLVSADMAHALHPAFPEKAEPEHAPRLGGGPAIKLNVNHRYSTEAASSAMFVLLCERAEVPWQWYVHRSDLACGSTVGPMLASRLGVRSIDVGNCMLSMHSVREQSGAADHPRMIKVMGRFLTDPLEG
jgi:aspartyl aminopeptidase